tara:strand:+ start:21 stop:791 length:771 start_codon:yes stop_codon:yes gene_type:complete
VLQRDFAIIKPNIFPATTVSSSRMAPLAVVAWLMPLGLHVEPHAMLSRPFPVAARARCARSCAAEPAGDWSMGELMKEAQKRTPKLGTMDRMIKDGPSMHTSSQNVVEFVLSQVAAGNISQAFRFTARGGGKPAGVHKSSTDWSKRMNWEKGRVISGACSGRSETEEDFSQMLQQRYPTMLVTKAYRFVGGEAPWYQQRVVEHMVEVQTSQDEQLLYRFKLVYEPLLHCHLIASVSMIATSTERFFPGAEGCDAEI